MNVRVQLEKKISRTNKYYLRVLLEKFNNI